MATHDESQAAPAVPEWVARRLDENRITEALQRALRGLYAPARAAVLEDILDAVLDAGGDGARDAFYAVCERAAALNAGDQPPETILSRARAGDARARERAPVPERIDP